MKPNFNCGFLLKSKQKTFLLRLFSDNLLGEEKPDVIIKHMHSIYVTGSLIRNVPFLYRIRRHVQRDMFNVEFIDN